MAGGEFDHHGLVAVSPGESTGDVVIGLAHLLLHRSTWSVGYYCYLEDLYVDAEVSHGRRRVGAGES